VHRLTQLAFSPYTALDPPSGAVRETLGTVTEDLTAGGGAIAELAHRAVGCLRWQVVESRTLHVRRMAVDPQLQRRGIGRALMHWAEQHAARHGCTSVRVGARVALPGNLAFYRKLGYHVVGEGRHPGYEHPTWLVLGKQLHATTSDERSR
jgi:ribosomal protein S18 acetylase RimI-like enzyme